MIALALALVMLSSSAYGTERQTQETQQLTGLASWYSAAPNTAAAGPAVRVYLDHDYMGARLRVCLYGTRKCRVVRISDTCLCRPPYVAQRRAIDLDAQTFAYLAPLSRGIVKVTITEVR
jgi:rare lipoprotein A (peptidoglycan hydrolase)